MVYTLLTLKCLHVHINIKLDIDVWEDIPALCAGN